MDIVFNIPVKPHVKKYIAFYYNIQPFDVTLNNEIGVLLFLALQRAAPEKELPLILGEKLEIRVPQFAEQQQGLFIPNKKIEIFNRTVVRLMKNELFRSLREKAYSKGDIKAMIQEFVDKYWISPREMNQDSLRRDYNRYLIHCNKLKISA